MKKKGLMVLFFFLTFFCFAKDMFRVHETQLVEMQDEQQSLKARLAINDMLVIKLPKTIYFLQGLSLEIKIPKAVADYRDAVAFYVYKNMSPTPTAKTIDYAGDRVFLNTFPGRLSYNFQIPLAKNHTLKESPYSALLPEVIDVNEGYVYFRLQLVMKGTPVAVLESEFDIEVKPILIDKGMLNLSLIPPKADTRQQIPGEDLKTDKALDLAVSKKNYALFIDEKPVDMIDNTILLNSGVHHLAVLSDYFRNEVRSFSIEQGKITNLIIQLETNEPTMQVLAPESVEVYFDDILLTDFSKPYQIAEGEHKLRFLLDGYEFIKSFTALRGKSYSITTNIDFFIEER
jgi:hypothetical protein